jgi:hypothetical protein
MDRSIKQRHVLRKGLLWVLAVIGSGTVLYSAGAAGLRIFMDRPPDSRLEMISPDGRHRIVITENLAGFPGAACIKQVYVLGARETFDRNDDDNLVFAGACDGLRGIQWDGARIQGIVVPGAAVAGVRGLTLRESGAAGEVRLRWAGR